MSNLESELRSLSAAEKFELLDAVWESLEAEPALTSEQQAELKSRIAAYEQSPSDVASWDQVKASLFRKQ